MIKDTGVFNLDVNGKLQLARVALSTSVCMMQPTFTELRDTSVQAG